MASPAHLGRPTSPLPSRPAFAVRVVALAHVALLGPILALGVLNWHAPDVWSIVDPFSAVSALAYIALGVLLALRRPGNAIGWLFLGFGAVSQWAALSSSWAVYGLETRPGALGADWALWIGFWLTVPTQLAPVVPLLLFPDGRLAGRAARMVAWLSGVFGAALVVELLSATFTPPGFPSIYERVPNPLAWRAAPVGDPALLIVSLALCALAAVGLLLRRFHAARGATRQQYAWVVLAMVLIVVTFCGDFLARGTDTRAYLVTGPLVDISIALLPIAMGIAILRHRLYDIDRVVNRTLVYGALTALLAAGYLGGVVALQRLLSPLTRGSSVAVAGTTLALAALARPARDAIQQAVDRRFNRRRYDAARALDVFSARLREELDLEALRSEICAVAAEAMQPASVSLWLRE